MEIEIIITCILSSAVGASLVSAVKDILLAKFARKNEVEDKIEEKKEKFMTYIKRQDTMSHEVEDLVGEVHKYMSDNNLLMQDIIKSNKLIMQDRIKHIASGCIKEGKITYEDRKLLHDMWDEYHNAWKGNGDLNLIIEAIDSLPLDLN